MFKSFVYKQGYEAGRRDGKNKVWSNPYEWESPSAKEYAKGYSKGVEDRGTGFIFEDFPPLIQMIITRTAFIVLPFLLFFWLSDFVDPGIALVMVGGLVVLHLKFRSWVSADKKKDTGQK